MGKEQGGLALFTYTINLFVKMHMYELFSLGAQITRTGTQNSHLLGSTGPYMVPDCELCWTPIMSWTMKRMMLYRLGVLRPGP